MFASSSSTKRPSIQNTTRKCRLCLTRLLRNAKSEKVNYENYLANIVALTKKAQNPTEGATYPASLNSPARRALYDNLGKDEKLALAVDSEIRMTKKDDWRGNQFKKKEVRKIGRG